MKKLATILVVLATVLVGLPSALKLFAQERSAQGFVEGMLESVLATEGRRVAIDGVSISLTGNVSARRVEIRDGTANWLVMEGLHLDWQPLSLFSKSLAINSLSFDTIEVLRLPRSEDSGVAVPAEATGLTNAEIKRLHVGTLKIASAVAGEDVALTIEGSGQITESPPEIKLDFVADRTDGKQGRLKAGIVLDPRNRKVSVDIALNEGSDGVISKLLSLTGDPAVDLSLEADGTFDDWTGKFILDLDKERVLAGTADSVSNGSMLRVTVDGGGDVGRLVPAAVGNLFTGNSQLIASIAIDKEEGRADIQRIRLDNDAFQLSLSGPLDFSGDQNNLVLALRSKDMGEPPIVTGPEALGPIGVTGLRLDGTFSGALSSPNWDIALSAGSVTSALAQLSDINFKLTGETSGGRMTVDGAIGGSLAQGSSANLPPSLAGLFAGRLTAVWPEGEAITFSLEKFTAGEFTLAADGSLNPQGGAFGFATSANTKSPRTGYDLADRLLRGDVNLAGRISGNGKGGLRLADWRLSSDAIKASVAGTMDDVNVDLALDATLDNLAGVDDRMTGSAQAAITLKGARQAPELVVDARGNGVTLLRRPLDNPQLNAKLLLDGRRPSGQFMLSGELEKKPVLLRATLATEEDGTRVLSDLTGQSGAAKLYGEVRLPPSGIPSGDLILSAPDLSDVSPFLLARLSGSLDGTISLHDAGGKAKWMVNAKGRDIKSDVVSARSLAASVTIDNALGQPRPNGTLNLSAAQLGGVAFAGLLLTAEASGGETYAVSLKATGNDLSADGRANVTLEGGTSTITLTRLAGRARGIPFQMTRPFSIVHQGGALKVDEALLAVGKGRIALAGQLSPALDARLDLTGLPLQAFAQIASVEGLAGSLSGTVRLTGEPSMLNGRFNVSGSSVTFAQLQSQGLKPLAFDASGTLASNVLTVNGSVRSGSDLSANATGRIDIGQSGSINLNIDGRAGNRVFTDRLAREGVRLEGAVSFALTVAGKVSDPAINGSVALSNATFGDTGGRLTVRNASGRIALDGKTVRVVSLKGATGRNGTAELGGTVALSGDMAADLRARISNGIYYDGTLVNAVYDADLTLSGPLAGTPRLSGTISLQKTKITLSEVPPSALKPLDVKHVRPPASVRRQLAFLHTLTGGRGGGDIAIDITLRAADPISISGRGLNATLGGSLKLTGSLSNPAATGAFTLQRGSLKLIARRLEFESGRLDFYGDLNPRIHLVAVSRRSDATITLTIDGRASEPEIEVTSSPEMPQEEALARLFFDQSMTSLSALQLAQIAGAIATLSGGGGNSGLLTTLQDKLGVDWLEVTEAESGETAVGIGKRLNDRLSIGVEQTTRTNTSRVTIDLNVSNNLKLRGGLGTDGSTRAGVFYEKDY